MEYKSCENGFFVRLLRGEEIVASLTDFGEREKLTAAAVLGIGAVGEAELGFFDPEKKEYLRRAFEGNFELINLSGNITLVEGEPFLHAHVTLGDREYRAIAGHLFSAVISVTGEFYVGSLPFAIPRVPDEATGLKLMDLSGEPESKIDVL